MIASNVEDRLRKFEDIQRVEMEMKKNDPSFEGFCLEVSYSFSLGN